jgi:hypothetical protein
MWWARRASAVMKQPGLHGREGLPSPTLRRRECDRRSGEEWAMEYIGIDVHKRDSEVCILDEGG